MAPPQWFRTCESWSNCFWSSGARSIRGRSVGRCNHREEKLWEQWVGFSRPWYHRKHKTSARESDTRQKGWLNNGCNDDVLVSGRAAHLEIPQRESYHLRSSTSSWEFRRLCEQGLLDRALDVMSFMDQQGTVPSVGMYRSLLKACTKRKAPVQAKLVHSHLTKHGLESATSLGEDVVSTLVKCDSLKDALPVFYRLPYRNVFCWTTIISGYANAGQGWEALRVYERMLEEVVQPNTYTFVSLLKACGAIVDLTQGKRIHAEIQRYNCECDLFVGTALVDMYRKCGSIMDAQNVFDGLPERNVVLWTAMLAAYVEQGQGETAMKMYDNMKRQGVSPDAHTYVSVLQACGMLSEADESGNSRSTKLKWLKKGRSLHADCRLKGYHSNVIVGCTLVRMYWKCGSMTDAQNAFREVVKQDVVSWNAMLDGYVHNGQGDEALQLYENLAKEGLKPNEHTFVRALQACNIVVEKEQESVEERRSECLQMGKLIHADAVKWGCGSDGFVGAGLISMYGKCGSIVNAQKVFDTFPHHDLVQWNAMLTAYVQEGQGEKVLQLYIQMRQEGTSPDGRTLVSALQSCGILAEQEHNVIVDGQLLITKLKSLEMGKELHAEIWRKGYASDIFVGNAMISMYSKCGSLEHARSVFDYLSMATVVSWNTMLAAQFEHGCVEQVFHLHEQMIKECVSPTNRTFVSVLQACGLLADTEDCLLVEGQRTTTVESLKMGKTVHAEAHRQGYHSDVFVGNTLISMYSKCGSIEDAISVFNGMSVRSIVTWNAILAACILQGEGQRGLQLYIQLQQQESQSTDARTCLLALQACRLLAAMEVGVIIDGVATRSESLHRVKAIHAEVCRKGLNTDVFVGSTLISVYGTCGSMPDAQIVFEELGHRDVVVSTAMHSAFVEQGQPQKALHLYTTLQQEGTLLDDEIALACILQACSNTGRLDIVRQVHSTLLLCTGSNHWSYSLFNSLISAYGRCCSPVAAQVLFDAIPQPDVLSWTALIAVYACHGDYAASLLCFDKMRMANVRPDGVTFLALIASCSHAGLVDQGFEYFESMRRDHGVTPELEHYVSMVDLFGRAGCFTRIEHLLSVMPLPPSLGLWLCVLGACRSHNNVSLGEKAFDRAVRLQPHHTSAYALMSNIYDDAGLPDLAKKVRQMGGGAFKQPGESWIEHEQEVHTFFAGDGNLCTVKPT